MLGLANIPFGVFFFSLQFDLNFLIIYLGFWHNFVSPSDIFFFLYFWDTLLTTRYVSQKLMKIIIFGWNTLLHFMGNYFSAHAKLIYIFQCRTCERARRGATEREREREGAICGDIKYKFLLSCFYRGGFYFYFFFFGPLGNWLNRTENSLDILIFRNENRTETASQREMRKKDGANARQKRWCERGEQEKMKRGRRKRSRQSQ